LTSARTVVVGDETFTATRGIILATGSKPATPPIPGLADTRHWTTHDAIKVEVLPESLIVLGGGAVGCELGQVFSRFGVQVTIVEGADRLLAREEPEVSAVLAAVFAAEGISVSTGRRVERVDRVDGKVVVTLAGGDSIAADELLVAAGRKVNLAELGLRSAGIDDSGRFIAVDGHMRAGDGIWAMGDVTGTGMLTHMAVYEGAIVAAGILGQDVPTADFASLPRVTFTDPEIGSIGVSEAEARAAGLDVAVTVKQVAATFRGWLHGSGNEGIIKLVVDRARGLLVGATSAGPSGGEVFGVLSTAVQARIPIKDLQHMIYAYPTFFGGIGEAIGAYGRGIGKVIDPEYAADVFDF
jgi:pyruvate/2-oxoglutarate dehydrogenase complex dihydrolipoamide dehydrogenase (E3) component